MRKTSPRSIIVLSAIALVSVALPVGWRLRANHVREAKAREAAKLFTEKISPLLEKSCVHCHGPEEHKGDLRLDSLAAALLGGQSGPALVPGDPGKSLLLQLVKHMDPKREMPPKDTLKDTKIEALTTWIKAGAPWPGSADLPSMVQGSGEKIGNAWEDTRNPIHQLFNGKRLDLWSLLPIANTAPPTVKNKAWVRNPLDAFVLAKIEATGEQPAPEADRHTLARRLYMDLNGLPPTPEEMDAFVTDTAPDAYSKLVEKLLNSPQYGEHYASLWQDVVRYSDSNGFDYDEFRPHAWRFRDYVIRSMNADKPYDRFVREQLAGDEMLAGPPENVAEQDCLIATGFLRIGPYDNSAVLFGENDRCRAQVMADMVETTGAAFLGLNMSCCRCHDHKVDPLSQADYYRLMACFQNVVPNDKLLLDLAPRMAVIQPEVAAIEEVRKKLPIIEMAAVDRIEAEKTSRLPEDDRQLLTRSEKDIPPELKDRVKQLKRTIHTPPIEAKDAFNETEKMAYDFTLAELKRLEKERSPYTPGFLATDTGYWAPVTHILNKGDYLEPGETVTPGILSVLDPNPLPPAKTVRQRTSGRRTALADWLFSPDNPLTSRVMANRLWQFHFGEGLQATPNDFGFAGSRPTNPELLDWLAREFMRSGWSMKHMHRLIVESATYRQSVSQDAEEKRSPFSNQKPRRLTAEVLRDSMLQVAGRLLPSNGGPPVWPELPPEVLNNPGLLVENEEKTRGWYPSPHENSFVRSIYLVQKRSLRLPMLETFDQPESINSCGRRNVSTAAPQALDLLNSDFATELAQSFAERLRKEAGVTPEAQIERGYALALQRPPDAVERTHCLTFLKAHDLHDLCLALMNLNEFIYVD
ncbi:PSD1 and planctomycete cytochrome C domain-containing protein [soil metagenome]